MAHLSHRSRVKYDVWEHDIMDGLHLSMQYFNYYSKLSLIFNTFDKFYPQFVVVGAVLAMSGATEEGASNTWYTFITGLVGQLFKVIAHLMKIEDHVNKFKKDSTCYYEALELLRQLQDEEVMLSVEERRDLEHALEEHLKVLFLISGSPHSIKGKLFLSTKVNSDDLPQLESQAQEMKQLSKVDHQMMKKKMGVRADDPRMTTQYNLHLPRLSVSAMSASVVVEDDEEKETKARQGAAERGEVSTLPTIRGSPMCSSPSRAFSPVSSVRHLNTATGVTPTSGNAHLGSLTEQPTVGTAIPTNTVVVENGTANTLSDERVRFTLNSLLMDSLVLNSLKRQKATVNLGKDNRASLRRKTYRKSLQRQNTRRPSSEDIVREDEDDSKDCGSSKVSPRTSMVSRRFLLREPPLFQEELYEVQLEDEEEEQGTVFYDAEDKTGEGEKEEEGGNSQVVEASWKRCFSRMPLSGESPQIISPISIGLGDGVSVSSVSDKGSEKEPKRFSGPRTLFHSSPSPSPYL